MCFQINGVDVEGARHDQVVAMLTGLERFVRLVVERESWIPPSHLKSPKMFCPPLSLPRVLYSCTNSCHLVSSIQHPDIHHSKFVCHSRMWLNKRFILDDGTWLKSCSSWRHGQGFFVIEDPPSRKEKSRGFSGSAQKREGTQQNSGRVKSKWLLRRKRSSSILLCRIDPLSLFFFFSSSLTTRRTILSLIST